MTPAAPPETPVVAAVREDGACAFYERDSGLCAIHRQAGAALLPVACQQFPRVTLLDRRGLFVTLSHYCPTAAGMLFREDVRLEIVQSPVAFPADFRYDPLDARDALPPLLRPGVLLDLVTFDRWEREAVAIFARDDLSAEAALALVACFSEGLCAWRADEGSLERYFDRTLAQTVLDRDAQRLNSRSTGSKAGSTSQGCVAQGFSSVKRARHLDLVLSAIPEWCRPAAVLEDVTDEYWHRVEMEWLAFAAPVNRYLAARLFGSWLAYQGHGLRTIVHSLAVALSVLKVTVAADGARRRSPLTRDTLIAAIRRTDELMLHLASREDLAARLSAIEKVRDREG